MSEKWERWAVAELAVMKEHYAKSSRKKLMQLLPGRTWKAITGAADRFGFARNRGLPMSKAQTTAMLARLDTARASRTGPPFAGRHHTAEGKLHLSMGILHAFGHSIADIALRHGIAEAEVKKILEKGEKRRSKHV